MKIEVFEVPVEGALHASHAEVWMRVLSDELVNLDADSLEPHLTFEHLQTLGSLWPRHPNSRGQRPLGHLCTYYPHLVTAEEKAEHGHSFEDWMVFARTGVS